MSGIPHASCGLLDPCPADLPTAIKVANANGFDFLVTPVIHPKYRVRESVSELSTLPNGDVESTKHEANDRITRQSPFTRSDYLLSASDWGSVLVGIVGKSGGIESKNAVVRRRAEESLLRELKFSSHLNLSALLLPVRGPLNVNLSRVLLSYMTENSSRQIWLRLPIAADPPLARSAGDETDPWEWWDMIRCTADFEKRLNVALDLSSAECLPDEMALKRWLGEPIKALVISTSLFLTNKKGFPVLPRPVQTVLREFIPMDVQVIVEGPAGPHNIGNYQKYLDHLWKTNELEDPVSGFAKGYEDCLQSPLQPLMDNLESHTYEVFEKDPIKYSEYQRAMYEAIKDKTDRDWDKELILMVLGAGRGPLVRAALKAADTAGRNIKVFAVEKNTNAVVTLLTQKEETWGDRVDVISSDMRLWKPKAEDRADIVSATKWR